MLGISGCFVCMRIIWMYGKLKVMSGLDDKIIVSKSALDQTLAEWMLPLLPAGKKGLWSTPSMYGRPDIQTVGWAVVSFLLRPCSFLGLAVFGERIGTSPTFTSYRGWLGNPLKTDREAAKRLMRKYLHCHGPATHQRLMDWLGCSKKQAQRLWESVPDEVEPVKLFGKKAFLLSEDKDLLYSLPLEKPPMQYRAQQNSRYFCVDTGITA